MERKYNFKACFKGMKLEPSQYYDVSKLCKSQLNMMGKIGHSIYDMMKNVRWILIPMKSSFVEKPRESTLYLMKI